ncbi:MAG TPA: hypothetical protein VLE95_01950 [Chlamydiales bacterium]|nr:hypothetical protein [Chlamydiales bacterium]
MNIHLFFPQMRSLVELETRLGAEGLSLRDIEEIERQIESVATDSRMQQIATRLFECSKKKKAILVQRQITRLDEEVDPILKYQFLSSLIGYLAPEEFDEKLNEITRLVDHNPKIEKAVKQWLEHLRFAQARPIIHDLDALVSRAEKVTRAIQESTALEPMIQWKEIMAGCK